MIAADVEVEKIQKHSVRVLSAAGEPGALTMTKLQCRSGWLSVAMRSIIVAEFTRCTPYKAGADALSITPTQGD